MKVAPLGLNFALFLLESNVDPYPPPKEQSFKGYNFKLKKLYRQGKLPKDLVDIGGNKLNSKNLSGDHAIPRSMGGKNTDDNMMLATKQFNSLRGNRPLKEVVTLESTIKWANQFINLPPIDGFNFQKYVASIFKILGQ